MPVYKERPLDNHPASPEDKSSLLLGPPSKPAATQALHLATNGDVLIGRAGNGAILIIFSKTRLAPAPRLILHATLA